MLFSASVEVFLRFLQKEYQWSTNSVMTISTKLAGYDITSVWLLAMCWRYAQEHFPIGMRKMIEKELRKRGMIPIEESQPHSLDVNFPPDRRKQPQEGFEGNGLKKIYIQYKLGQVAEVPFYLDYILCLRITIYHFYYWLRAYFFGNYVLPECIY